MHVTGATLHKTSQRKDVHDLWINRTANLFLNNYRNIISDHFTNIGLLYRRNLLLRLSL